MLAYPVSTGTAALYLTPDAAKRWRSSQGVTVYTSPEVNLSETEVLDAGRESVVVDLRTSPVARLDRQGHFTPGGVAKPRSYVLQKIKGQWRISNPQDGVMVTRTYYDDYFRPFSLYFFDAPGERVVPDLVHLAVGEQLPTALVTALARGPGRAPGTLRTYVPGVGSLRPSVTVGDADVADVEFSTSLTKLSAARSGASRRPDRVDAAIRPGVARRAHLRWHADPVRPGRASASRRLVGWLRAAGRERPHLRPRRRQAGGDRRPFGAARHGSMGPRRERGGGRRGGRRLRGRRSRAAATGCGSPIGAEAVRSRSTVPRSSRHGGTPMTVSGSSTVRPARRGCGSSMTTRCAPSAPAACAG